jgi:LacI family transcriptional regulator
MRTTVRDVAREAGVAISSVSRVLSGHPNVREELRQRVLEAADRLGYRTNLIARSFRTDTTRSIGFIVGDISNPLMAEIALGAERVLAANGYATLLTNSEGDPNLDAHNVGIFEQRRVDGVLLSLASERHARTLAALRALDVPRVVIDRRLPPDLAASAVWSDHAVGVRAAVDDLVSCGHHRIALVVGNPMRPSRERQRAFEKAAAAHDLGDGAVVVGGSMTIAHGEAAADDLLTAHDPPTAIILGGNQLLVGALRSMRRHRISVGTDVSLVTCDDLPLAELHDPPIAVVTRDLGALGRTAAELLVERLGGGAARTITLPTDYVHRPSVVPRRTGGR